MDHFDKRAKSSMQWVFLVYNGNTFCTTDSHMDLKAYFKQTKRQDREAFAKALGVHHDYLYRCSRGTRKPGSELCKEIVRLDSRFTLAELRPDIWGNGLDGVAASDDTQPPVGSSGRTSKRKNGGSNGRKTKEQRLPSRV